MKGQDSDRHQHLLKYTLFIGITVLYCTVITLLCASSSPHSLLVYWLRHGESTYDPQDYTHLYNFDMTLKYTFWAYRILLSTAYASMSALTVTCFQLQSSLKFSPHIKLSSGKWTICANLTYNISEKRRRWSQITQKKTIVLSPRLSVASCFSWCIFSTLRSQLLSPAIS